MRTYRFLHVDVFTEVRFGGNQLAVFVDSQGLSTEEMQKIANEMNFSESTFILPPESAEANWKVRIFTPRAEIPFAGHPTLGTAYVLAKEGMVELKNPKTTIMLEMKVGLIPVELEVINQKIGFLEMTQNLPTFGQELKDIARIAKALSIDIHDVENGLPVEVASSGLPFLFVPVKTLRAINQIKPNVSQLEGLCEEMEAIGAFVFTKDIVQLEGKRPSKKDSDKNLLDMRVHSRMFAPLVGVPEDPATGSASGPLGCYLIKNGVISPKSRIRVLSEQGYEMGRPSALYIEIGMVENEIINVKVGGYVIHIAEGSLFIE